MRLRLQGLTRFRIFLPGLHDHRVVLEQPSLQNPLAQRHARYCKLRHPTQLANVVLLFKTRADLRVQPSTRCRPAYDLTMQLVDLWPQFVPVPIELKTYFQNPKPLNHKPLYNRSNVHYPNFQSISSAAELCILERLWRPAKHTSGHRAGQS